MLKEFHYYLTKILSITAGFAEDDAQTIAYACQYVDDANEINKRKILGLPDVGQHLYKNQIFKPVVTAYKGIQNIGAIDKDNQRTVLMPFHFVPNRKIPKDNPQGNAFKTVPDGEMANKIVDKAVDELNSAADEKERKQKLIKLGIAVHTYADTWAHQNFSGRSSQEDNEKENLELYKGNTWLEDKSSFPLKKICPAGHGTCVGLYPDQSYVHWRYKDYGTNNYSEFSNPEQFLNAAKKVYGKLVRVTGQSPDLDPKIEQKINECISSTYDSESDEKIDVYKRVFYGQRLNFNYDNKEWKKSAIKFDYYKTKDDPDYKKRNIWVYNFKKNHKNSMNWFYFHLEAYEQRKFVTNKIPVFS